jgi:hypothetical protein
VSLEARWHASLGEIEPDAWDALAGDANPFLRHSFLSGLETTGCLQRGLGWTPHHLGLWRDGQIVGAAPCYEKTNSHGEFVFDHAWAHAYARYGLDYFPKLLCGVPYSPVTGPRLLSPDPAVRRALSDTLAAAAGEDYSSAHVNFAPDTSATDFADAWLARIDVQYHWENREGWSTFDDFLAAMDHKHRKNIRQERAKVQRAGVTFRILHGDEASEDDLCAIHGFYLRTFQEYGNSPALTLEFLRHLAASMPRNLVIFLAEQEHEPIAGALCLRGGDTLYGRYWGASRTLPGLHFETCYYQGIEYCLREGLTRFEPGAQGEHKLARGFLPVLVRSRHWIADPQFAQALSAWCEDEAREVRRYVSNLLAHSPFKQPDIERAQSI